MTVKQLPIRLFFIALLVASPAFSSAIDVVIPDATLSMSLLGYTNPYPGPCPLGAGPGCLEVHGNTALVTTSLNFSYYTGQVQFVTGPQVLLSASSASLDNTVADASVSLQYSIYVAGPDSTAIPVDVDVSLLVGTAACRNPEFCNTASIWIEDTTIAASLGCGIPTANCAVTSFQGTLTGTPMSNTFYKVNLAATSFATLGISAKAVVDPHIYIDPTFASAGDYTLKMSAGIGNNGPSTGTPEPGTLLLTAGALAALAFRTRGTRRRT